MSLTLTGKCSVGCQKDLDTVPGTGLEGCTSERLYQGLQARRPPQLPAGCQGTAAHRRLHDPGTTGLTSFTRSGSPRGSRTVSGSNPCLSSAAPRGNVKRRFDAGPREAPQPAPRGAAAPAPPLAEGCVTEPGCEEPGWRARASCEETAPGPGAGRLAPPFAGFPGGCAVWPGSGARWPRRANPSRRCLRSRTSPPPPSGRDALPLPMQDLLCMNNDFPPRAHCLVRWYGLREFVVLAPAANNDAILSESKCNLLLSSISIALGNTGCQVPLFVQIHHKWRRMYMGECQGPGVRTDFEMVHLRKVPSQYIHLSGLLDIFKSKIGCPLTPLPPVSMAIRLTYVLQDWQQYFWPQQPPDIDALVGGEVGGLEFGKLPFGACEDPISELHLATTWPHLTEGIVVDNDVYSDLDPIQAPQWSVRVRKADNPQCLLGDFLTEFFKLCRRKESTDEILGRSAFEEEGKEVADISHALSKLTEPAPVPIHKLSVTNMVHSAKKKIRKHRGVDESPLNNEVLNTILLFLFPDAAEKLADGFESRANTSAGNNLPPENEDYNLFSQFKSAPSDSLTYKLALCLCMINFYHGGVKGVAHLWQEFVLEMRYRWENNYLIPGLANGPPDLRCCLLHQKLQMLNCCIERKKARDEGKRGSTSDRSPGDPGKAAEHSGDNPDREKEVGKSWESWSDSEEEFFECLSDTEDLKGNGQENGKKGGVKEGTKEPANLKPEGRLHPHGKLTLLHPGEPLYIPITQEPAPMTEDLLEEQSEVLAKLGTSAEGAHLRARMQSACLLSDMESFKAANPGCCLEDFVRWYSPRDYIEEEVVDEKGNVVIKGGLSARMRIPSNMWVEAWETAKPVPARRQKRLFDDTREAEKVLHYLAIQKPADLARHLLPCVIHAAVLKKH
ncbi:rab3 GTPase-activating protein catalytic subunit isoform X4 [Colius striatus]|uniref:rab3 GTPase-activating protein catalytic subunit isoform X4 n=1 Tax=Colius striatus TaxID=57412 RepID=UPI002B1D71D3|nr:rab3 GTPase-activating protein catalytic subunit isoform X4 [Colius striatus]